MFTIEVQSSHEVFEPMALRHARLLAEAIAWDERTKVCVLNEAGNVVYEVEAF